MSIFSQFQRTASQMVKRWHPLLVSIALALFCARLASADISTTGDVNPDPNTTTSSDPLYVGQASAGSMQVDDGSVVDSGFSHVGYDATATGSVRISGNGSAWNSQGLSVGRSGVGELAITAGAILDTTGPSHVGQVSGSAGMATISGAGSRWNATPYVYVGSGGTGELTIEEGGALNGSLTIGYFSDSQGTVTVQGASANLIGPILRVGEMGRGELLIANGATVVTTLSSEIGKERGSPLHAAGVGTVTVTGTGSEWRNDENVAIGVYGKGELMISDGGVVSCEHGWIAVHGETFFENSEGTVTVTGSGSVWAMTERLTIAGNAASGGDGTLTIGPGGLVQVGNSTSIGPQGRVKLDGGTFSSPIISIFSASGDGFEWTAGKLHTERFGRSLLNPAAALHRVK